MLRAYITWPGLSNDLTYSPILKSFAKGADAVCFNLERNALTAYSSYSASTIASFEPELVKAARKHADNVLRLMLQEQYHLVQYDVANHLAFRELSEAIAESVAHYLRTGDYLMLVEGHELACLPAYLGRIAGGRITSMLFFNIALPRIDLSAHESQARPISAVVEILQGALSASVCAFQLDKHRLNVLEVARQLGFECNRYPFITLPPHTVQLATVRPGIDYKLWSTFKGHPVKVPILTDLPGQEVVLSISDVEPATGILERIAAVEIFFQRHQHHLGNVTFLWICRRANEGMEPFDEYWAACLSRAKELNQTFATGGWLPLRWIENSFTRDQLIGFYRNAPVLWTSALCDNVDPVSKQYVAAQCLGRSRSRAPGVLVLSWKSGAFAEQAGQGPVFADPNDPSDSADAVNRALSLPHPDRRFRMRHLKTAASNNANPRSETVVDGLAAQLERELR